MSTSNAETVHHVREYSSTSSHAFRRIIRIFKVSFNCHLLQYSTQAASSVKKLPSSQKHRRSSVAKDLQTPAISPNVTASHDHRSIIAYKDTERTTKREARLTDEPEWRYMRVETGKLRKYCLMLSKIRLTCKQIWHL